MVSTKIKQRGVFTYALGILTGAIITGAICLGTVPTAAQAPLIVVQKPFPDVPANHWAATSVADLKAKGIVKADASGKFGGDKFVTRYEAAVLLDRFVHYMEQGRKPLRTSIIDPKNMPKIAPGPAHDSLVFLTTYRFIPVTSSLLTKPGDKPITAPEFADSLGWTINRITDRSVAPSNNSGGDYKD